MKNILFSAILLLAGISATAQNFLYTYDASGNRTRREILRGKAGVAPMSADTANLVSEELLQKEDLSKDAFEVKIFPNPSSGNYRIDLPELKAGEKGYIRVYSSLKLEYQTANILSSQTIDLTNKAHGAYILHVIVNGQLVIKRLLKQ